MLKKMFFCFLAMTFVSTGLKGVYAQEKEDEEGSEDHPMISRFEGSYIVAYEMYNYNELELATGIEEGDVKKTTFEGEVISNVYKGPEGSSSLEVLRNYQIALKEAGFDIVYKDEGKCDDLVPFKIGDYKYGEIACGLGRDSRYLFARLTDPGGDILVSVHTAMRGHNPYCLLQVVEEKPMPTGKVEVKINSEAMKEDIEEGGSVRIYGIHFDTDEATIKEESGPTLAEIATLLKQNPGLELGVVGHTDATGETEYNMELSRKRAESVVEYLTSKQGIAEDRLHPYGVGPLSPVASNDDEDDRARNRRVELVKMTQP